MFSQKMNETKAAPTCNTLHIKRPIYKMSRKISTPMTWTCISNGL